MFRSNNVSREDVDTFTQLMMNRLDHVEFGRLRELDATMTRRANETRPLENRSSLIMARLNSMEVRAQGRSPLDGPTPTAQPAQAMMGHRGPGSYVPSVSSAVTPATIQIDTPEESRQPAGSTASQRARSLPPPSAPQWALAGTSGLLPLAQPSPEEFATSLSRLTLLERQVANQHEKIIKVSLPGPALSANPVTLPRVFVTSAH